MCKNDSRKYSHRPTQLSEGAKNKRRFAEIEDLAKGEATAESDHPIQELCKT